MPSINPLTGVDMVTGLRVEAPLAPSPAPVGENQDADRERERTKDLRDGAGGEEGKGGSGLPAEGAASENLPPAEPAGVGATSAGEPAAAKGRGDGDVRKVGKKKKAGKR